MRRLMQGRQVLAQNLQTSQLSLHVGLAGVPRIAGHHRNYAHITYSARTRHIVVFVRCGLVRVSLHHRANVPVSYGYMS